MSWLSDGNWNRQQTAGKEAFISVKGVTKFGLAMGMESVSTRGHVGNPGLAGERSKSRAEDGKFDIPTEEETQSTPDKEWEYSGISSPCTELVLEGGKGKGIKRSRIDMEGGLPDTKGKMIYSGIVLVGVFKISN